MSEDPFSRTALINSLVSRSTARNRDDAEPPTEAGIDLFRHILNRFENGVAIEYPKGEAHPVDDERISKNTGKTYIRISDMRISGAKDTPAYVSILFEYFDENRSRFPVVDPIARTGRHLSGHTHERGAVSAHMVVRLPAEGSLDEGKYRCVIESVSPISRSLIEYFLSRQIRRVADDEEWEFEIARTNKKTGRLQTVMCRYTARLELFSDVGRKLDAGVKTLTGMTFTKRETTQSVGGATVVKNTDFVADVRMFVSVKKGPDDPSKLAEWTQNIIHGMKHDGYEVTYSFKHASGVPGTGTGELAVDGATDLVMCTREPMKFTTARDIWEPALRPDVVEALRTIVDKDELWERPVQA